MGPEVFAAFEGKLSQPKFLGFWAVPRVKFTCIDKDWAFCFNQLLNIVRVVNKIVHNECFTDCRGFHLEDRDFCAITDMNSSLNCFENSLILQGEIAYNRVFYHIPIGIKDTIVVRRHIS